MEEWETVEHHVLTPVPPASVALPFPSCTWGTQHWTPLQHPWFPLHSKAKLWRTDADWRGEASQGQPQQLPELQPSEAQVTPPATEPSER